MIISSRGLLAALLVLALAAPALAADKFTVAVNNNDRPFGYTDEKGELTGFSVAIAKELCRVLQADCTLVPVPFAEFVPGVAEGRFDFAVANVLRTAEREKSVDFTDRYWRSSSSFVGKPGVVRAITPAELAGKRIAVQKGSQQERYLRSTYEGSAVIDAYATNVERNAALTEGRAELMLGSTISHFAFLTTREGQGFELIGEPMFEAGLGGDVGLPIRKGRDDLRQRLNDAIAAIVRDGTHSRINNQYFPVSIY